MGGGVAVMVQSRSPAAYVARMGVLFALALTLSLLEGMVPLPFPLPGVRIGLSNIVVMYCLFLCGTGSAYCLGVLKALFVLLTRTGTAALLSLAGGIFSITAMLIVKRLTSENIAAVSVAGALAHNIGQLVCAALVLREGAVLWYYLPLLAAVGILVGMLTAVLLRAVLPMLKRFHAADRRGS